MERVSTMRPSSWHPPVELAAAEESIVTRMRRARLFVFLRRQRHAILTDVFHDELAAV
jgi:transposase